MEIIAILAVLIVVVLAGVGSASINFVQQYQRGVVLRFGRLLPTVREPGLRAIVPFVDRMTRVPVNTTVLDVPSQNAITRDNVTIGVDAVVYFKVADPVRATINVDDYLQATSQVARTSLRSVIGRADLDTLLSDREQVNAELRAVIDAPTEDWGVSIDRVEIKDIALPEGMRRSMSRQAEAERDRRARVISAEGELEASQKLTEASERMSAAPGALQLRLLQTVTDVASDKNSTLVMPLPVELLRFLESGSRPAAGTGGSTATSSSEPDVDRAEGGPDGHHDTAAAIERLARGALPAGTDGAATPTTGPGTAAGTGQETAEGVTTGSPADRA